MKTRFGSFEFDTGRRELRRADEVLHLSPKEFSLLETLLETAPNAVSREELYQRLWGESFVEEVNLSNLISDLRERLGDSAREPRFIRTIHGYGYAFVAELERRSRSDQPRATSLSLIWKDQEFPLREGQNVIGRHASSDIVIPLSAVSRHHASIDVRDHTTTIRDLGSKNGTSVDEQWIEEGVEIMPGVQIRLGTVLVTLREVDPSATTHTAAEEE